MTTITWIRVGLATIGILVWAYGYRIDDPGIRWIGIGVLAVVVLLRFWSRDRPPAS